MKFLVNNIFLSCFLIAAASGLVPKEKFIMNEHYVCIVKPTCIDCLRLSHCSWCPARNKCFSKELFNVHEFCPNSTIDHQDFGLSIDENSECSCSRGEVEQRCYPPGVFTGPVCSGRGTCVCGQCLCKMTPDPEQPTKMVMGEYCEFDNFSCDGPKCNEGPYSISNPTAEEENSSSSPDDEIPPT